SMKPTTWRRHVPRDRTMRPVGSMQQRPATTPINRSHLPTGSPVAPSYLPQQQCQQPVDHSQRLSRHNHITPMAWATPEARQTSRTTTSCSSGPGLRPSLSRKDTIPTDGPESGNPLAAHDSSLCRTHLPSTRFVFLLHFLFVWSHSL